MLAMSWLCILPGEKCLLARRNQSFACVLFCKQNFFYGLLLLFCKKFSVKYFLQATEKYCLQTFRFRGGAEWQRSKPSLADCDTKALAPTVRRRQYLHLRVYPQERRSLKDLRSKDFILPGEKMLARKELTMYSTGRKMLACNELAVYSTGRKMLACASQSVLCLRFVLQTKLFLRTVAPFLQKVFCEILFASNRKVLPANFSVQRRCRVTKEQAALSGLRYQSSCTDDSTPSILA